MNLLCVTLNLFFSSLSFWVMEGFFPTTSEMPFGTHSFKRLRRLSAFSPGSPGQGPGLMGLMPELRARRCWTGWKAFPYSIILQTGNRNGKEEPGWRKSVAQQTRRFVTAVTGCHPYIPEVSNAREETKTQWSPPQELVFC